MPSYDVYAGFGEGRRMCRVYSFNASDDLAAEEFVADRLTDRAVELWFRSRRVAYLEGKRSSARL